MKAREKGSIELMVMGLIAALIVVLAIPLLTNIGKSSESVLKRVNSELSSAVSS